MWVCALRALLLRFYIPPTVTLHASSALNNSRGVCVSKHRREMGSAEQSEHIAHLPSKYFLLTEVEGLLVHLE